MKEDIALIVGTMGIIIIVVLIVSIKSVTKEVRLKLERFMAVFSYSFHEARWVHIELHERRNYTDQELVEKIMANMNKEITGEFMELFTNRSWLPKRYHYIFVEDITTIAFVERMIPTLKRLYRKKRTSAEELKRQFFDEIQKLLLAEVQKDHLLHITRPHNE